MRIVVCQRDRAYLLLFWSSQCQYFPESVHWTALTSYSSHCWPSSCEPSFASYLTSYCPCSKYDRKLSCLRSKAVDPCSPHKVRPRCSQSHSCCQSRTSYYSYQLCRHALVVPQHQLRRNEYFSSCRLFSQLYPLSTFKETPRAVYLGLR